MEITKKIKKGFLVLVVICLSWVCAACGVSSSNDSKQNAAELFEQGNELYECGAYAEAVAAWEKAAKAGSSDAMCNIAHLYEEGDGVEQNYERALEWLLKAAKAGNSHAVSEIGPFYKNGLGVEQDYEKALEWFLKAAEAGDADAMYESGLCYENGWGVEQNCKTAIEWYKKAEERGSLSALFKCKTEEAMVEVTGDAGGDFLPQSIPDAAVTAASAQGGTVEEVYQVVSDGKPAGYAVKVAATGCQGTIEMVVGMDVNKAITGIKVIHHSETSGIGTKVCNDNAPAVNGVPILDQFIGLTGSGSLIINDNISPVSGATVSSESVAKGANAALAVVEIL